MTRFGNCSKTWWPTFVSKNWWFSLDLFYFSISYDRVSEPYTRCWPMFGFSRIWWITFGCLPALGGLMLESSQIWRLALGVAILFSEMCVFFFSGIIFFIILWPSFWTLQTLLPHFLFFQDLVSYLRVFPNTWWPNVGSFPNLMTYFWFCPKSWWPSFVFQELVIFSRFWYF